MISRSRGMLTLLRLSLALATEAQTKQRCRERGTEIPGDGARQGKKDRNGKRKWPGAREEGNQELETCKEKEWKCLELR